MITPKQWRYLAAYAKAHRLRPQLGAIGLFRFTTETGGEIEVSMLTMKHEYEAAQAEEKLLKKRKGGKL